MANSAAAIADTEEHLASTFERMARNLPQHRERLQGRAATARRIAAAERGQAWKLQENDGTPQAGQLGILTGARESPMVACRAGVPVHPAGPGAGPSARLARPGTGELANGKAGDGTTRDPRRSTSAVSARQPVSMRPSGRDPRGSPDDRLRRAADKRNQAADRRDRTADKRDRIADERDPTADERDQSADQREAELDERCKALGLEIAGLRKRAEDTVARSNARIARTRSAIERDAAALLRDQTDIQRKALRTRRTHADIDRRHHEALAEARATIQRARTLRGALDDRKPDD